MGGTCKQQVNCLVLPDYFRSTFARSWIDTTTYLNFIQLCNYRLFEFLQLCIFFFVSAVIYYVYVKRSSIDDDSTIYFNSFEPSSQTISKDCGIVDRFSVNVNRSGGMSDNDLKKQTKSSLGFALALSVFFILLTIFMWTSEFLIQTGGDD